MIVGIEFQTVGTVLPHKTKNYPSCRRVPFLAEVACDNPRSSFVFVVVVALAVLGSLWLAFVLSSCADGEAVSVGLDSHIAAIASGSSLSTISHLACYVQSCRCEVPSGQA
eukprot:gnl/TRDRNA2_/TRDRNA2_160815_c1_seq1.p1 gnl/TRDRNA2_/TRDRNA2_160815_c1~~gnl/TRDRNA2_/TRDRNA2_160815_c1_seq1.p1  ORF type:complete len:111 (+),score=2.89 gnl/TRDRNA2_/TRDRNA2_160815_c1_seq1:27-359(+)